MKLVVGPDPLNVSGSRFEWVGEWNSGSPNRAGTGPTPFQEGSSDLYLETRPSRFCEVTVSLQNRIFTFKTLYSVYVSFFPPGTRYYTRASHIQSISSTTDPYTWAMTLFFRAKFEGIVQTFPTNEHTHPTPWPHA